MSPRTLHRRLMAYAAEFDPQEVIRRHAVAGLAPRPGRLVNFLGTVVDPDYFGPLLAGRADTVEPPPIPGNWHACVSEWAACLRAVDLAPGPVTIVELGCGWGCWLNNMAVAARRTGRDARLVGVEGDADHREFARRTCLENGIPPERLTLHAGIAAARAGVALFPRQRGQGGSWGLEPLFNVTEAQREAARQSGRYDELPMLPLESVIADLPRVDLLHVDIQGGEADLIEGSRPLLAAKVAALVVGTHGHGLERRIRTALEEDGWRLEIERPAILRLGWLGPRLKVDGVQGWRNPALVPA